jgi:hypothetical protein
MPALFQMFCRVRKWRCRHSLPLESDVKVSRHPARAVTKLRFRGVGSHNGFIPTPKCVVANTPSVARAPKSIQTIARRTDWLRLGF